jgi:hypothetical protein
MPLVTAGSEERGERTRASRLLTNLLLAASSVVVTLLALEGVARIAQRGVTGKEARETVQYSEHDDRLGWRKRPGARVTYRRSEYTVEVAINREGLRDLERSYGPHPGVFRFMALGDSFVEGYSVAFEDGFTQVLEKRLAGAGCRAEVINAGTQAYSTDQEFLFYVDEGTRYLPDVVGLFFYYNDVVPNALPAFYGAPKPLLAFGDDGYEITNFPIPLDPGVAAPVAPPRPPSGSALVAWTRERILAGAPKAYDALARLGLWPKLRNKEPDDELKVYNRGRFPTVERGWEATERILAALAREVGRRDSRLVVVYVPSRFEVNDAAWDLTLLAYQMKPSEWSRDRVLERLQGILARAGIPLLDLRPALRREDRGILGGPYYAKDGHWNARGHRTAAHEVEGFLHAQGWLKGCEVPSH